MVQHGYMQNPMQGTRIDVMPTFLLNSIPQGYMPEICPSLNSTQHENQD